MSTLPRLHDTVPVADITTGIIIQDTADHAPGVQISVNPDPDDFTADERTIIVHLTTAFQPDVPPSDIAADAIAHWIDTFLHITTGHPTESTVDHLWANIHSRPVLLGVFTGLAIRELLCADSNIAFTRRQDYRSFRSALQYFTLDTTVARHATHHTKRILENREHGPSGAMEK